MCGAHWREGKACEYYFGQMLELEFKDPIAGSVHHWTVACYMLQHDRYSDEGRAWIQGMLEATLERGVSPADLRETNRDIVDQSNRDWKVTRSRDAPPSPRLAWPITIVDVAMDLDTDYPEKVRRWAASTLATLRAYQPASL
jgi:hypothetical protein